MLNIDRALWLTLEPYLDQALDMVPESRAEWLRELRLSEPRIAEALSSLLLAATGASGTGLLDRQGLDEVLNARRPHAGERVGSWMLDREVGAGGMGTVWLAHRSDEQFRGNAAVKLLNASLLHGEGLQRFRREGNVLARLSHPNIARLLDAGVSESSRPFLVLEYVDGERLDTWTDTRKCTIDERVALFRQVIGAVAHAHTNLIVHRDLKPSNVMVDTTGFVKLLDFGIAKLLDPDDAARPDQTLTDQGRRVLTPEYAAPEQVEGSVIGTATDVYALGVLLYQSLTGVHPTGEGATTATEFLRAATVVEPLRMSLAVTRTSRAGSADTRAALRQSTPSRLRRALEGDLDNIAGRALAKVPGERYATVAALGDDLARWARHEPVLARPDSLGYRLTKFTRRNRAAVGVAAVAAIALLGATVMSLRSAAEARIQRDVASMQARRAQSKTEFQQVLLGFMGEGLSANDLLDRARTMLATNRGDQRDRGYLHIDLATAYGNISDFATARVLLREARQVADSLQDHTLAIAAACQRAWTFTAQRQYDSAAVVLADYAKLRTLARGVLIETSLDCELARGLILNARDSLDAAVYVMQSAIAHVRADSTMRGTSRHSQVLFDYARMLRAGGRTRDAIVNTEQSAAILTALGMGATTSLANVAISLSGMHADLGELRDGQRVISDQMRRSLPNPDSGLAYAPMATTLAQRLEQTEYPDSALRWYARALRDTANLIPQVEAYARNGMARVSASIGRVRDAEEYLRAAAAVFATMPKRPDFVVVASDGVLRVLALTDPEAALLTAMARIDSLGTATKPGTRAPLAMLLALDVASELALTRRSGPDAAKLARAMLSGHMRDTASLTRSAWVGKALFRLGDALRRSGNEAGARDTLTLAVTALRHGLGVDRPTTLRAQSLLDSVGVGTGSTR
jgi:eukaryotic-like serine/threonine-protein kinase